MAAARLPKLIGIVGAGQLGSGIAQACITKGLDVVLCDTSSDALEHGTAGISKRLQSSVKKEKLTGRDAKLAFERLKPTTMIEVRPVQARCAATFLPTLKPALARVTLPGATGLGQVDARP